ELAGKWMSADVVNVTVSASSVVKGESLIETAQTIAALGADIVVVRHPAAGVPRLLSRVIDASVINAGDGMHEHPTQALLDLFTIREAKGTVRGLHVVLVGDILHSRVARSNIWGLLTMGARVTVVGPPTLIPPGLESLGVRVRFDLDAVLPEADVVNMLRIQRERQKDGLLPDVREYRAFFALTEERLRLLRPDALILHPGPANLGVEIVPQVLDDPRARIHEQVTNGVAVRVAWLLKGGRVVDPASGVDQVMDVLIENGVIAAAGHLSGAQEAAGARVLDCTGKVVAPGLIDAGARLGEPGFEHRETIATACEA